MPSSSTIRQQLHQRPTTLRRAARRRALVAGAVLGPLASAGFGFSWIGVPQLFSGADATAWVFAALGLVSIALALVAGLRLMRTHHRGTRSAVQAVLVVGVPLAALARPIVAEVIIAIALDPASSGPAEPLLVYSLSWLALAAPGLLVGPFAAWLTAHLNRHLPSHLATDAAVAAKYEQTTRDAGPGAEH